MNSPADDAKPSVEPQAMDTSKAKRGVQIGSIFVFVFFLGVTLSMPFMQAHRDHLGCDALCNGAQGSARSTLTLVGSMIVGRASDRLGRRPALFLGLVGSLLSLSVSLVIPSLLGMWLALVPSALLNQNSSVMKALFADYFQHGDMALESERAGALGRVGMAMGIAMMVGNGLGGRVASSFWGAQSIAIVIVLCSAPLIQLLPVPAIALTQKSKESEQTNWRSSLQKAVSMPVLKTRGAQLLILLRVFMGLAFWIFYAIWAPSLKRRFNFGAAEYGQFFAFIGLVYALAQGVIAKPLVRACPNHKFLVLACMVVLGGGRVGALLASDVRVMYLFFAPVIVALGVVNIIFASGAARLAGGSDTGGLYGILEACESVAGMVGPALGGIIAHFEETHGMSHLVLMCVLGLYAINVTAVVFFYDKYLTKQEGVNGKKD